MLIKFDTLKVGWSFQRPKKAGDTVFKKVNDNEAVAIFIGMPGDDTSQRQVFWRSCTSGPRTFLPPELIVPVEMDFSPIGDSDLKAYIKP